MLWNVFIIKDSFIVD